MGFNNYFQQPWAGSQPYFPHQPDLMPYDEDFYGSEHEGAQSIQGASSNGTRSSGQDNNNLYGGRVGVTRGLSTRKRADIS